jgi:ABC-type cobalamin/Fe3+-siderophores transport system ATPase subunit
MKNQTIKELEANLNKHKNERVCVIGTMCCGKTTLLKQIPNCVDMDEELFSQLTKEEAKFICQMPWTKKSAMKSIDLYMKK